MLPIPVDAPLVIVVGAGVSGLLTGAGLADAGCRVCVLDKEANKGLPAAHYLLPKEASDAATAALGRPRDRDSPLVGIGAEIDGLGRNVPREVLYKKLSSVAESKGVEITRGFEAVSVWEEPGADGRVCVKLGIGTVIRADACVIATGAESTLRQEAFPDAPPPTPAAGHTLHGTLRLPPHTGTTSDPCLDELRAFAGGNSGASFRSGRGWSFSAWPAGRDTVTVVIASSSSSPPPSKPVVFAEALALFPQGHFFLALLDRISWDEVVVYRNVKTAPPPSGISAGRIVLVGDAAGGAAVAGAGDGMVDAAVLADCVRRSISAERAPFQSLAVQLNDAFSLYARVRRRHTSSWWTPGSVSLPDPYTAVDNSLARTPGMPLWQQIVLPVAITVVVYSLICCFDGGPAETPRSKRSDRG